MLHKLIAEYPENKIKNSSSREVGKQSYKNYNRKFKNTGINKISGKNQNQFIWDWIGEANILEKYKDEYCKIAILVYIIYYL
jgi:hypothetical protein